MPELVLSIFRILVVFEMSAINLYNVFNVCAKRAKRVSTIIYCVFLVLAQTVLVAVVLAFVDNNSFTSAINAASYSLWLFPLFLLTGERISRLISMLCTTMGFTLLGTTIAVIISYFLPQDWQEATILFVQTIIYAFFAPWYAHFCKSIFATSSNEPSASRLTLLRLSVFWYLTVFFTYFALTVPQANSSLFCVLSLGLMGFSCYSLLRSNARSIKKADKLTQFVYEDDLTGLSNRTAFFSDGQMLIARQSQFDVVFLDLNKFKSINDSFGHLQGNNYLIGFAKGLVQANVNIGTPYRMSGDEFVCIVKKGHGKILSERLASTKWQTYISGCDFLGVSVGYSSFPEHGSSLDVLVQAADKEMYKDKGVSKSHVRSVPIYDSPTF